MEAIDPMALQILTAIVVDLVAVPLFGLILNRVVTQKLDAFDRKREEARRERKERLDNDQKWQDAMTLGVRSMLRSEIFSEHHKWMERGYCPTGSKEYVTTIYEVYHDNLGGNGLGKSMYSELMSLPTKPRDDGNDDD